MKLRKSKDAAKAELIERAARNRGTLIHALADAWGWSDEEVLKLYNDCIEEDVAVDGSVYVIGG